MDEQKAIEEFEEFVKKEWPSKTYGDGWLTKCELACMQITWLAAWRKYGREED